MQFIIVQNRRNFAQGDVGVAYLIVDNWNDWFKYQTLYRLIVIDYAGEEHEIGEVKIGQFNWRDDQARPDIPDRFERLPDVFFSLGQDDSYYEALKTAGDDIREAVLAALNDIALNDALYERALDEDVTRTSLLRSVSESSVTGQFRRIARGGARLTAYSFRYVPKARRADEDEPQPELRFDIEPESQPPTNIIGRNGVGKTHLLHGITKAIVGHQPEASEPTGTVGFLDANPFDEFSFAGLISVSFSAFDRFQPLPEPQDKTRSFRYSYVGLKFKTPDKDGKERPPKTLEQLGRDFSDSVRICLQHFNCSSPIQFSGKRKLLPLRISRPTMTERRPKRSRSTSSAS